jgi:hypothetical protein
MEKLLAMLDRSYQNIKVEIVIAAKLWNASNLVFVIFNRGSTDFTNSWCLTPGDLTQENKFNCDCGIGKWFSGMFCESCDPSCASCIDGSTSGCLTCIPTLDFVKSSNNTGGSCVHQHCTALPGSYCPVGLFTEIPCEAGYSCAGGAANRVACPVGT